MKIFLRIYDVTKRSIVCFIFQRRYLLVIYLYNSPGKHSVHYFKNSVKSLIKKHFVVNI